MEPGVMRGAAAWCNVYLALGHRHDGSTGNWVRETEQRMSREQQSKEWRKLKRAEQSVGEQDRGWCKSKSRHKVLHAVQTQMTIDQHVLYQCIIGEWPKKCQFYPVVTNKVGLAKHMTEGAKFCSIAVQWRAWCIGHNSLQVTTLVVVSKSLLQPLPFK